VVSPYGIELPGGNFSKIISSKTRFGFIGRITFVKGVHLLLEAFASLSAQEEAHLTIYGETDEKSKKYGQALKDDFGHFSNIDFAGRVDNASISQVYRQLDILVVPSIWPENSPITILEAQAHGVPVTASDVPGIADLVQHEVNGLVFTNQNAQDLARQMVRCLNEPGLIASLAQNSTAVKSMPDNAQEMVAIYRSVLSS